MNEEIKPLEFCLSASLIQFSREQCVGRSMAQSQATISELLLPIM